MAAIYRLVKRLITSRKNGKPLSEWDYIIPSGLSMLGVMLMVPNDQKLFKVLLFSSAIKALVRLIGESTGWFDPIREDARDGKKEDRILTVETVLSYLSIVFLCYCYLFEVESLSRGMVSTITKGCGLSD